MIKLVQINNIKIMIVEKQAVFSLTDSNFEEEVLNLKNTLVLVDFWAPWCGPCQMMAPAVEAIAKEYLGNDKIKVGKLNIDENADVAEKYQIRSIPTIKFFFNGQIVNELIGAVTGEKIRETIEKSLLLV